MTSIPSPSSEPVSDAQQAPGVSVNSRPTAIPWDAYYVVYFVQATIMSMILTNVPVFLRQSLALDWLVLITSYVFMTVPVLLRPLLAWVVDRRPALLSSFLIGGMILVVAGSAGASAGAFVSIGGIMPLSIGFAVAVVGATLMNVAADSHIVRAVPLDLSAKVNSRKRLSAFFGIVLGQGCYLFMVGTHFGDFSRWTIYFAVPAVVAATAWIILGLKRGRHPLPDVEGLPQTRAPWLVKAQADAVKRGRQTPRNLFVLLLTLTLLFTVPDGLIEATFENFVVETYGGSAWLMYLTFSIAGVLIGAVGYLIAGRSSKRAPEWTFLWYVPVLAAFDLLMWVKAPFLLVLVLTVTLQIPISFMLVRLLQSWQGHSYTRRPALTFQAFIATYQLGKLAGIGISGFIMVSAGYPGIFAGAVITWVVVMGLAVAYHFISRK